MAYAYFRRTLQSRTRPSGQSHRELGEIAEFVDSPRLGPLDATELMNFSSGELAEQAPRGKEINRFKAFGEPVVNPF